MTEPTGSETVEESGTVPAPEPEAPAEETAAPVPPADADPQEVAEEAADAEPAEPGLFVPDNQPEWLVTALRWLESKVTGKSG